ncbi:hypothetical protein ASPCADRAFT_202864 [Aspergillus carbonarius ITEM 5010]|uniref:Uncharacterized protein n=1 Tax=Aspergillus carbonarius (strain ITEM 5010) TaxID=602072 RepID=A0A1R3S2P5_ASPC5|nr:hypothetical protein ASPCADRAFT_202864 [Aspergillus carbonarius ITEM 5010]
MKPISTNQTPGCLQPGNLETESRPRETKPLRRTLRRSRTVYRQFPRRSRDGQSER